MYPHFDKCGTMNDSLRPTLWRTCRALANKHRLEILRVLDQDGPQTVSKMRDRLGQPISCVSENLRALNARGLLTAKRQGREVRYELGADPTVPGAKELLQAVLETLRLRENGDTYAFKLLTALTHYRRHQILFVLTTESLPFGELCQRSDMSRQALQRHIAKLHERGFIVHKARAWHVANAKSPLHQCLLSLAAQPPS